MCSTGPAAAEFELPVPRLPMAAAPRMLLPLLAPLAGFDLPPPPPPPDELGATAGGVFDAVIGCTNSPERSLTASSGMRLLMWPSIDAGAPAPNTSPAWRE